MKAEIPILASDLPEIRKIIDKEKTGLLIKGFKPDELIEKIRELLWNENLINEIKKNLYECSKQYCWEIQEEKLIKSYLNQVNQKN